MSSLAKPGQIWVINNRFRIKLLYPLYDGNPKECYGWQIEVEGGKWKAMNIDGQWINSGYFETNCDLVRQAVLISAGISNLTRLQRIENEIQEERERNA